MPSCTANGGQAPCWQLTAGTGNCGGGMVVDVSTDPNLPPSTAQNATVNCALCDPNFPDPNRGCTKRFIAASAAIPLRRRLGN